jgi:hypothetical protein
MSVDIAEIWSEGMSAAILGAHVIIGLTFHTRDGQCDRYEQMHGRMAKAELGQLGGA